MNTVVTTTATGGADNPNVISRLWRDKDTRSVIIQIITLVAILTLVGFLFNNLTTNLAALGKEFNFDFLTTTAAYDISFSPFIEYTSRSTHLDAAFVGLQNTLLVAFFGIILSTILGFSMGIARLSKNWLLNRIVYCFLEFARNVPVLLHILLIYGIIITSLPAPKNAIDVNGTFFLSNRSFGIPAPVFEAGFGIVVGALALAIVGAFLYRLRARKLQAATGKQSPVFLVSLGLVIVLPLLAYFAMGGPLSWEVPVMGRFNFKGGLSVPPEFFALWIALSYYTACFIAEIVRAGILAVSHGQTEASRALGLRENRILQLVVVPQALRVIVPPLASQYLNLTKNSSLAIAIGYQELVSTIGGTTLMQTGKEVETMLIVLATYLVISLSISAFMNWFNSHMKLAGR